jgi:hypothetical protein
VLQQFLIIVQQDLTATFTDAAETGAPGCTRTVIRTWRAVDACGNTGTQTKTITYSRDLTPPTFTLGTIGAIPCNPTQAQIDAAVVLQQLLIMFNRINSNIY